MEKQSTSRWGSFILCLAIVLAALANGSPVHAQNYPTRPITLSVGFAPGGSTDKLARLLAQAMQKHLGQQVIVENRPGAAGNIAAQYVAQAAPNGYTLFMATLSSQAINPWLYEKPGFDPIKSFEPVALVARYPLVMAVAPSLSVGSAAEALDYIYRNPGKVFFSSAGLGSPGHLSGELLKSSGNFAMTHVPYKGGAPAMLAVMSGEVTVTIETSPAMIPLIKAGKLKGLAVTSSQRSAALSELPTLSELGVAGFEVTSWTGIEAPAQTPKERIEILQVAIFKSLEDPLVLAALASDGAEASFLPGEKFRKFKEAELQKWGDVVRLANFSTR